MTPSIRPASSPRSQFRTPRPPMDDEQPDPGAESRQAAARLNQIHGTPTWHRHRPPLDEPILTVLSRHTSDANSVRACDSLRTRVPAWDDVPTAPTGNAEAAIRSGGSAAVTAPRIQPIMRTLADAGAAARLDRLVALPPAEARR